MRSAIDRLRRSEECAQHAANWMSSLSVQNLVLLLLIVEILLSVYDASCKNTMESIHGLMSQVIKDRLFNQIGSQPKPGS